MTTKHSVGAGLSRVLVACSFAAAAAVAACSADTTPDDPRKGGDRVDTLPPPEPWTVTIPPPSPTTAPAPPPDPKWPLLPPKERACLDTAPPTGTRHSLGRVGDAECQFELGYVQLNENVIGFPPVFQVSLVKEDVTAGSCKELKGWLALTGNSYTLVAPAGAIVRHPTDKLVAITFDEKGSPSGESPTLTHLFQIDWTTGDRVREGIMAVDGASAGPPAPSLVPSRLVVLGRDLVLGGDGKFPGATGTGSSFAATYARFFDATIGGDMYASGASQQ